MNIKPHLYKTIAWSTLTILLITVLGYFLWIRSYYPEMNRLHFQVWMKATIPDTARLYYDRGQGFSEEHSIAMPVNPDGLFHRYRLPLPEGPIRQLRFDALTGHGMASLKGIAIVNGLGEPVRRIDLHQLHPVYQIKTWILKEDQVDLETDDVGKDPQIMILLNTPITTHRGIYLNIRQIGIIFFIVFCGTLILVSLIHLWMHRNDEALHTLIVLWCISIGWLFLVAYDKNETKYLQLSLRSSEEGTAQLYYDLGNGFSESHSTSTSFFARQILFTDYQFRIPDKTIYAFRFDPPPSLSGSSFIVRSIDVVNGTGSRMQNISFDYLQPANEIEEITRENQSVTIHTVPNVRDPQTMIQLPYPLEGPFPFWKSYLSYVFPRGIILCLSFFVVFSVWKITGSPESRKLHLRWVWEGIVLLSCIFLFTCYATGTWQHTTKFVKAWLALM